ncbi:CHASE2 domain-containing protein [Phormidium sp. LEGE 05292]|uniref:CHASE2 domain-containing protein n=1 Tax=[Phormidium] sp. LEGE 05292 TaxID=767427 RepID=UPI0018805D8A|nr:CHASE2 domain-containing protein [Phormidium sp. LEGE 05292]MBE9229063.1 CHASE2 domain-containing protein [Phormidium sp. LEGE 05292]
MSNFRLKVQKIEQICLFELSWGKGQQISCRVNYPQLLTTIYQEWQRIYLNFYKSSLRGRIEKMGGIAPPPIDWHARLVQAEAKYIYEFHFWLHSAEIFEIRRIIANSILLKVNNQEKLSDAAKTVNIFLTCEPLELARLPWETWEIGAEFPTNMGSISIIRTPQNIHQENNQNNFSRVRRKKGRILAILGDETGLNFQSERQAVLSCSKIAEIKFIGWQPGSSISQLKESICANLADEQGWDILFFAGHSNETQLTGGELAIGPNISLSISEIIPYLKIAQAKGLQFALFNSCNGINIAESLIDLGLSQVVIMREPIHNSVAQTFLIKFLQVLAAHKNVQEATVIACQYLKLEHNLTYPSAFLIPSLFCHPEASLFRIPTFEWKQRIKQILPTKTEGIVFTGLALISLVYPVQDFLLEKRILSQAIYRQLTAQIPQNNHPPVLLVQIDEESIRQARIADPKPMDRIYLAKLVDKLSSLNARVVGIDYLLDRPLGKSDRIFSQSLQSAVKKQPNPTWFVFATVQNNDTKWLTVLPEIAKPTWSLQGYINISPWYVEPIYPNKVSDFKLPFSYILALAYQINLKNLSSRNNQAIKLTQEKLLKPNLSSQTNLFWQVNDYLETLAKENNQILFSSRLEIQELTKFSYKWGQMWLQPIIDFSIPPGQIYQTIPAWQLLKTTPNSSKLSNIQQQVIMIVPGDYGEAGVFQEGQDNYNLPNAISYWLKIKQQNSRQRFTGGETHAYIFHHFINSWIVIPIPDLWLIAVAGLLGKIFSLTKLKPRKRRLILVTAIAIYGIVSLQIYLTAAILLPWFLPAIMVTAYALPALLRKKTYASN